MNNTPPLFLNISRAAPLNFRMSGNNIGFKPENYFFDNYVYIDSDVIVRSVERPQITNNYKSVTRYLIKVTLPPEGHWYSPTVKS